MNWTEKIATWLYLNLFRQAPISWKSDDPEFEELKEVISLTYPIIECPHTLRFEARVRAKALAQYGDPPAWVYKDVVRNGQPFTLKRIGIPYTSNKGVQQVADVSENGFISWEFGGDWRNQP